MKKIDEELSITISIEKNLKLFLKELIFMLMNVEARIEFARR